ncbi:RES family NAD+ phosphorylase [uncultured Azohydromonas sp.]|uniref:RES family NAD+ phosphorylase n=1 Tax=uncultured Azohydromonas sp. TaxID=487342 RepID=UPI002601A264|nr:RES family NAD+ phosphorylase [uncultured Azohydromonas sp.]
MTLAGQLASGALKAEEVAVVELQPLEVWRVYSRSFGAAGFNATGRGNARFSPLKGPDGEVVPTLYAGTTLEVALMETVLHDLPSPSAGFILTLDPRIEPRRVARLRTATPLRLADFTSLGLRRLGLQRSEVIDSHKSGYALTRQLAGWLYRSRPDLQGIWWTSRQDDRAQALLLFATRLPPAPLATLAADERFDEGAHMVALTGLLDRLGASLQVS